MVEKPVADALVANPSESLSVELKRWIDPTKPEGVEKIAKGVLALRNRNGGYLVVGFDNGSYQPDLSNEPVNSRELFHPDTVQGIVSKYTAEPFEVEVAWGVRDGHEYPVIVVPSGVRSPVAAKRDLLDEKRKAMIREGAVYFRTLSSNGTPSSAEAKASDWRDIVDICVENREADIGRFLRRHLGASGGGLSILGASGDGLSIVEPSPTLGAVQLLNDGLRNFNRAVSRRQNLTDLDRQIANGAKFEAALVIAPSRKGQLPTATFRRTLSSGNPELTGWPIWLDSSGFIDELARPVVMEGAWEALIFSGDHLDFNRFDPAGKFYLLRNLQDDTQKNIEPRTILDPVVAVLRVAETIAVGLSFGRTLGWKPGETKLGFAFRWSGLVGRKLEVWANRMVHVSAYERTASDSVMTFVEVPLDTPSSAIAPAVQEVVKELFVQFGGYEFPMNAIESWTRKLIERKF